MFPMCRECRLAQATIKRILGIAQPERLCARLKNGIRLNADHVAR